MKDVEYVLKKLAAIADAYENQGLDEHRPEWGEKDLNEVELIAGRGGRRLLTLNDAFCARKALQSMQQLDYDWQKMNQLRAELESAGEEIEDLVQEAKHAYVYNGEGERQQLSPLLSNLLYARIRRERSTGHTDTAIAHDLGLLQPDQSFSEALDADGNALSARDKQYLGMVRTMQEEWYSTFPGVKVKRQVYEREAFFAGAHAFMSANSIARPFQERALPAAYHAWEAREE